jgi:hypothetical protein
MPVNLRVLPNEGLRIIVIFITINTCKSVMSSTTSWEV